MSKMCNSKNTVYQGEPCTANLTRFLCFFGTMILHINLLIYHFLLTIPWPPSFLILFIFLLLLYILSSSPLNSFTHLQFSSSTPASFTFPSSSVLPSSLAILNFFLLFICPFHRDTVLDLKKENKKTGQSAGKNQHKNLIFSILGLVWNASGDY